jgi:hypothetical protein
MACIPGSAGAADFFWQPMAASPIKARQLTPWMRFKAFLLTQSFLYSDYFSP